MKVIGQNNRFNLNGVEERVLERPNSRDGDITFTMGGMAKFATTMPLADFEEQTGFILKGLEPEQNCIPENEFASLLARLEDKDMTISKDGKYALFSANIKYTNASNSTMAASMYARKNDDGYLITVTKSHSAMTNSWDFQATEQTLPSVIKQAEEKIDSILKLKVQVLSLKAPKEDQIRQYSDDGFPILFKNESLDDYFKSQDMQAGIVINANSKYQYFHSYTAFNGPTLSYDTKDYKTLKGCVKRLNQLGYDERGRQLDIFPTDETRLEFEESIRDAKVSRDFHPSWSDDILASYKTQGGSIVLSSIKKLEDPKFGFQYFIDATFTNERDGRQVKGQIEVDPREGGNAYQVGCRIYDWTNELAKAHKEDAVNYEADERTIDEKISFHQSMLKNYQEQFEWVVNNYKDNIYTNSAQKELAEQRKSEFREHISHHKSSLQVLGQQVKEMEKEFGLNADDSTSLTM